MKNFFGKALLTGAIMTSLLGATAFAAGRDPGSQPPPPSVHREQQMSPHGAPGFGPEGNAPRHFRGERRGEQEKLPELTEEQRQQLDAERREIFAKWPQMSDSERRAAQFKFRRSVRKAALSNLSIEERAEFLKKEAEQRQEREAFRNKWKTMSEEERNAWREQKHKEFVRERTKNMTADEKERFLKKDAEIQKRQAEFRDKWNNMSDAEKEQWKKDHPRPGHPPFNGEPRRHRGFGGPQGGPPPDAPAPDAPSPDRPTPDAPPQDVPPLAPPPPDIGDYPQATATN